jgi:hypothetical protein
MRRAQICVALVSAALTMEIGRQARADSPACTTATDCVDDIAAAGDEADVTEAYLRLYAAGPDARRAAVETAKEARNLADVGASKMKLADAELAVTKANGDVTKATQDLAKANADYELVKTDKTKEPAANAARKAAQTTLTGAKDALEKTKRKRDAAQRRDALNDVIAQLESFNQTDAAARQKLFDESACAKRPILCLDRDGVHLNDEETDPTLLVGDQVTVLVFSNAASDKEQDFAVVMSGVFSHDRIVGNDGAAGASPDTEKGTDKATRTHGNTRTEPPKPPPYRLIHKTVSAEITADTERLHLVCQRKTTGDEHKTEFDLHVQRGTYHLEINVAGAFVPWGARTVKPSGHIETDTDVTATFGFTWYFGKRTDGTLAYPSGARAFGLSFATDFNFTISPVDKNWYAGLVYSPLQGLGFAAGVALVHGQFRTASIDTPDLIDETSHFERRAMLRPYAALVLTPELFGSLLSASNRTRKQFADAQTADTPTPPPATSSGK